MPHCSRSKDASPPRWSAYRGFALATQFGGSKTGWSPISSEVGRPAPRFLCPVDLLAAAKGKSGNGMMSMIVALYAKLVAANVSKIRSKVLLACEACQVETVVGCVLSFDSAADAELKGLLGPEPESGSDVKYSTMLCVGEIVMRNGKILGVGTPTSSSTSPSASQHGSHARLRAYQDEHLQAVQAPPRSGTTSRQLLGVHIDIEGFARDACHLYPPLPKACTPRFALAKDPKHARFTPSISLLSIIIHLQPLVFLGEISILLLIAQKLRIAYR